MVYKLITSTYSVLMSKKIFAHKTTFPTTRIGAAGIWLVLLMSSAGTAYAQKDVVITTSGDRLVGEIIKVEKDVLTLSTDYSDSDFKIKWEKIASIESDRHFLVETSKGSADHWHIEAVHREETGCTESPASACNCRRSPRCSPWSDHFCPGSRRALTSVTA